MTLRRKFLTFAVLIHSILIVLALFLLFQSKILFAAVEIVILISLPITFRLYRSFLKPLDLLAAAVESIRDRDFSTTFVLTGHDELDQLIEVYNRMIEELREERIKQQQQHFFLKRLVDATPIGVVIMDLEERVTMLNPAALEILGGDLKDVLGQPIGSAVGLPATALTEMVAGETRIINVSGTHTYKCRKSQFTDRGFYRHFILIEELTKEILSTQKKAYDKVIRMMSHEINNSVGAVNSILQSSMHYRSQLTDPDRDDFEQAIQVAIDRNTGLNKFMAHLADVVRIPPPVREDIALHEMLRSVQILMSGVCQTRNVVWNWELADESLIVFADQQQLEQVLVNVVKNAIEAIGQTGTITVRTTPQPEASLQILDTGKGLDETQRQNLFTPFYSTKKDGQGIGLTLIREILVNHGFSFNLEPGDDGRTVFWIEFSTK